MSQKLSLALAAVILLPVVATSAGCEDDVAQVLSFCRTNADCTREGETCQSNQCQEGGRGGGRGDGTLDAGGGDDTATGEESDVGTSPVDLGLGDTACVPSCGAAVCGPDGCGGTCGSCAVGQVCASGACVAGGGTGASCRDTIGCINECTPPSEACFEACVDAGTPRAQADIASLLGCISAECGGDLPEEEFQQCQNEACGAELDACNELTRGTDRCAEVFSCLLACPDQACGDACLAAGTRDGSTAAVEFYNCGVDNCSASTTAAQFTSCTRTACPTEATACDAN